MMDIHKTLKPFLKYFRSKRMKEFEKVFMINGSERILDVRGSQFNWSFINSKPKVYILNLEKPKEWIDDERFEFIIGDATKLQYADNSFELVYSNSVIEHLFNKYNQIEMAKEVLRVGKRVYIQTPAKEFFVEPHLITPFIHWLPLEVQRKLMRNFTLWGLITRPSQGYIDNFLKERRLLTFQEFCDLFPNCEIEVEHFLFMPKSYIAIKN